MHTIAGLKYIRAALTAYMDIGPKAAMHIFIHSTAYWAVGFFKPGHFAKTLVSIFETVKPGFWVYVVTGIT